MSDPGAGAAAEADTEPFPCSLILRTSWKVKDKPGERRWRSNRKRGYGEDVGDELAWQRRDLVQAMGWETETTVKLLYTMPEQTSMERRELPKHFADTG